MNQEEFVKRYDTWIREYSNLASIYAKYLAVSSINDSIPSIYHLMKSCKLPIDINPLCKKMCDLMTDPESWSNIPEYDAILRDQSIEGLLT